MPPTPRPLPRVCSLSCSLLVKVSLHQPNSLLHSFGEMLLKEHARKAV